LKNSRVFILVCWWATVKILQRCDTTYEYNYYNDSSTQIMTSDVPVLIPIHVRRETQIRSHHNENNTIKYYTAVIISKSIIDYWRTNTLLTYADRIQFYQTSRNDATPYIYIRVWRDGNRYRIYICISIGIWTQLMLIQVILWWHYCLICDKTAAI